jgi:predicted acylesterase/phospholipase RssA
MSKVESAAVEEIREKIGALTQGFDAEGRRNDLPPCDLIMQGGVASGVVYPLAIMRIAQQHELRGVGGTSAGAIGAVVAAAAEYGRRHGRGAGYAQLGKLSHDILDKGIGRLFQPTPGLRGLFDLLVGVQSRGYRGALSYIASNWPVLWLAAVAGLLNTVWLVGGSPTFDEIVRIATTYGASPPMQVLASFTLAGLLLWLWRGQRNQRREQFDGWLSATLLIGLAASSGATFAFVHTPLEIGAGEIVIQSAVGWLSGLSALLMAIFLLLVFDFSLIAFNPNRFGVCSGVRTRAVKSDALMDWLHGHIQDACGLEEALTFGDLETSRRDAYVAKMANAPYTPPIDTRDIELRMTVTDLGLRRPHTLPFLPEVQLTEGGPLETMWYVPEELEKILPSAVVDKLCANTALEWGMTVADRKLAYPLPRWHQLPVLFAVRMSLCYPLLFRMVPLYHPRGEQVSRREPIRPPRGSRRGAKDHALVRTLFTDGGICSNFPIHFYDGLLPSWPTLAIALEPSEDPESSDVLIDRSTAPPPPRHAPLNLAGVLGLVLQTMGGWRDKVQTSLPGYRERVCVVSLSRKQGGFDFDMAPNDIAGAMLRGLEAGQLLCGRPIQRHGQESTAHPHFDLEEHRYRRFLVAYARLEETLGALAANWLDTRFGDKRWPEVINAYLGDGAQTLSPEFPQVHPSGNKIANIRKAITYVDGLAGGLRDQQLRMQYDVPEPPTNLRVTPRE